MRIFAPDAPFSKRSENAIFELFVRQLAGLEQVSSPFFKTCVELLEKLALLKAFVLVMDNEEIMCDLFQCIYRAASLEHGYKIFSQMAALLGSLIVEMGGATSEPLLDVLLTPLAEYLDKGSRSQTLNLAIELLRKHESTLVNPVSSKV